MVTCVGSLDWLAACRGPPVSQPGLQSKCSCSTLGLLTSKAGQPSGSHSTAHKRKLQPCCCRPCLMVRGRSLLSLLLGSSIPYFVEISLSSSPRMGNLTSSCRQHGHTVSTRTGSTAVTASMAVEQMSAGADCNRRARVDPQAVKSAWRHRAGSGAGGRNRVTSTCRQHSRQRQCQRCGCAKHQHFLDLGRCAL